MKPQPTSAPQPLPELLATRDGRLVLLRPVCEAIRGVDATIAVARRLGCGVHAHLRNPICCK